MNIDISIIIPVYNVRSYLKGCLESILGQASAGVEVIAVDDGSTDGSGAFLDTYGDRIAIVHQPNCGVVSARQAGVRVSNGRYIWFVDGDDEIPNGALKRLRCVIASCSIDLIQFQYSVHYRDGKIRIVRPHLPVGSYAVCGLVTKINKTPMEIVGMCIGDKIYRREIAVQAYKEIGAVKIRHSEDGLFAVTALLKSKSYMVIATECYRYILRASSSLRRYNPEAVAGAELFVDSLVGVCERSRLFPKTTLDVIRAYHSYASVGYVVMALIGWNVGLARFRSDVSALNRSNLIKWSRLEMTSFRRRMIGGLLKCPCVLYFFLWLKSRYK